MIFAVGGTLLTLSLAAAVWATSTFQRSTQPLHVNPGLRVAAARIVVTPPPTSRGEVAAGGRFRPVAMSPLDWNELALMLRTGLSDEEVINVAASKQLTTAIGPEQEQRLRALGAGDRLVGYLRSQPVYGNASFARKAAAATAPSGVAVPASMDRALAPAAVPVVDYEVRDRKVAELKKQIDQLDEDSRVVRIRPQEYRFRYQFDWHGNRVDQTSYDAYLKRLDEQRDELRREKWRLEGR